MPTIGKFSVCLAEQAMNAGVDVVVVQGQEERRQRIDVLLPAVRWSAARRSSWLQVESPTVADWPHP